MNLTTSVATSRLVAAQRAIEITAHNVANAETPGFKAERVQFADWLSRPAGGGGSAGGAAGEASIAFVQDRATWHDQAAGALSIPATRSTWRCRVPGISPSPRRTDRA